MPVVTVRLVLLRPRNPENLGAVARVMRNFGLDDWAIVEIGTHDFAAARRVAVHAEELLDRPRLVRTLDEAVADCAWVVGTTSRQVRGKRRLSPGDVAREARARGEGRTAIVFGDERSGLTSEEVHRCHDLSAIPADAAQPSLNLAQAVLVYAWALHSRGLDEARNLAFSVIVFSELFRSFAARSTTRLFWEVGAFTNLRLLGVVLVSGLVQLGLHNIPFAQTLLGTGPLSASDCALAVAMGLVPVSVLECSKLIRRITAPSPTQGAGSEGRR
jgi:TrmH family RNA methyltransferase